MIGAVPCRAACCSATYVFGPAFAAPKTPNFAGFIDDFDRDRCRAVPRAALSPHILISRPSFSQTPYLNPRIEAFQQLTIMPSIARIIELAHTSYFFLRKIGVEFPKAVSIMFIDHFMHISFIWAVAVLWIGYNTDLTGISFGEFGESIPFHCSNRCDNFISL